jgi:hypothetical protein
MPEVEFTGPGALARWAGIRPQRLDISAGMRRELLPLVREINNSSGIFTNGIGDPRGVTREQSIAAYREANEAKLASFQRLRSITSAYDQLLRDSNLRNTNFPDKIRAIHDGITKGGGMAFDPSLLEYMDLARKNIYTPVLPTEAAQQLQRFYSKSDVPWEEIYEWYRQLNHTTISE